MKAEIARAIEEHGPDVIRLAMLPFVSEARQRRIDEVLDRRLSSVTVVLENLYDGHNGAAALRSVEAFGLTDLHAVEEARPFKFGKGISIGCEQWMEIHKHRTIAECAEHLRDRGFVLTATLPDATMCIDEVDGSKKRALLFGNEHEGLTDKAVDLCDELVRIPMYGFTQSFNLSVSVALLTERAAARRREAIGVDGDVDTEKKRYLRACWYAYSVRGAPGIIERYVARQTQ